MYSTLLSLHSLFRWLVLLSLVYAIYRGYRGSVLNSPFKKTDNAVRHWTATIAHIQLALGCTLYFTSPIIKYFLSNFKEAIRIPDLNFFGLIHMVLMLVAVVIITIGSALSKRRGTDREKFRTMLIWFTIALLIIFIAIPWPFSPLAGRPYFRPF